MCDHERRVVARERGIDVPAGVLARALVAEQEAWKNAANIQLDWVFPYQTTNGDVRPGEEERAGLYFTTLMALRRPGPIPAWTGKPVLVLQAINEIRRET